MSPADNTPTCDVCGMAYQVNGCTPKGCGITDQIRSAVEKRLVSVVEKHNAYMRGEKPPGSAIAPAAPEHPLPWRWEENQAHEESLVSADGRLLITAHDGVSTDSAYVRAVTERAAAMEQLLRRWLLEHDSYLGSRAKELAAQAPAWARVVDTAKMTMALLAEIDAAKAGG